MFTTLKEVKFVAYLQLMTISGFSIEMILTKVCLRNCQDLSKVTNLEDLDCLENFDMSG